MNADLSCALGVFNLNDGRLNSSETFSSEMKIELPPDAPHINNGTLLIQPIAPSFHSFIPYVTNDTSKIHITHHGESPPTGINWLFIFNTTNTHRTQHGRFSVQYSTAVACSKVEFSRVRNLYSFIFADNISNCSQIKVMNFNWNRGTGKMLSIT